MAEKIKLLEADIDFEKLLKKGADAKKSIEFLKNEVKFFQNSIKEGKGLIETYRDSLSKMEKQGKQNSKEYKIQENNLKALVNSQESNRQKMELVETSLRKQQKSYRLNKKGIDSYNKTVFDSNNIIEKTDGSIKQLEHALAENKNAYRELTTAQREQVDVGGKLFKVISQQDQEYKELQKSIGTTQVDVGNYKGQIKELLDENINLSKTFKRQIEQIPIVGSLLGGVYGILLKYAKAQRLAITTTTGSAKALKIFRLALISTGIGAIVVGLGLLVAALASSEKFTDGLTRAFAPLKGAFGAIIGVVQQLAFNIKDIVKGAFGQFKDNFTIITNSFLNGITKMRIAWNKLTGDTKEADELQAKLNKRQEETNAALKRTAERAKAVKKAFSEGVDKIKEGARVQREIVDLGIKAEEAENRLIVRRSELNKIIKEQNKIAEDTTKSVKEREAAAKRSIEASKELVQEEQKILDIKIKQKTLEHSLNETSREDQKELNELIAQRNEKETQGLELQTTQTNKLNQIRQSGESQRQKAIDNALKKSKTLLDIYIAEQGVKAKTLQEELTLAENISSKKKEILKAELKAKKITQSEYNLAVLELDNELIGKRAEIAVDNATRELQIFKDTHQSKLDANTFFTEELLNQEVERLDLIAQKEREYHEARLEQGVINQQEYHDAINEVDEENRLAKEELQIERDEAKKEQEAIDLENQRIIDEENFLTEFEIKTQRLETQRKQEVANAKDSGADVQKINEKYAKRKELLDKQVQEAKLNAFQSVFGQIKGLFGEETAVGKAAAIAETTINTYKAATAAYSAMSGIPIVGPALGAVAAGLAVAAGIANVKKIASTKTSYQDGGLLQGKSHAQGGIPFTIGGQSGFEAEGGEFMVNKISTAKYRPLLEHINSQNGVGKINTSRLYQNGGIVTSNIQQAQNSQTQNIDYETLALKIGERVGEANRQLPNPIVAVEDINTGQSNVAEVVNGANLGG